MDDEITCDDDIQLNLVDLLFENFVIRIYFLIYCDLGNYMTHPIFTQKPFEKITLRIGTTERNSLTKITALCFFPSNKIHSRCPPSAFVYFCRQKHFLNGYRTALQAKVTRIIPCFMIRNGYLS